MEALSKPTQYISFIFLAGILAGTLVAVAFVHSETDVHPMHTTTISRPPFPAYSFTADAPPERLHIPHLNIDTPIEEVGLTSKGVLDVIKSYTAVGWYKHGPYPGARGSAVIEGHYDTDDRANPEAIFFHLKTLVPGDEVHVTDTLGRILAFEVVRSEWYPYNSKIPEIFASTSESRLNLITCGGTWLMDKRVYDKRLVVFTKRVN